MSWTLAALIVIGGAALMEMPLFTAIAGVSAVCLYAAGRDWLSLQMIFIEMNRLASTPVLVALPLFTFTGCLLTHTDAPQRIMNFTRALAGWLPGGLAIAALGSCAFFTALTGASGVTIVAMGGVLYPVLRQRAYRDDFTLGLLTTSGSLGLLFPPSLAVILYGVISQIPIGDIFTAALLPGVMLVLLLSLYCSIHRHVTGRRDASAAGDRTVSWAEVKKHFRRGIWDWPVLIILVAGVYGGFVTIAEVSAAVLVYVVAVECLVLREVKFFRDLPAIMVESAVLSGAIIIILGVALGFTGYLVDEQIPNRILKQLTLLTANRFVFLAGLNLLLLAVGCIMDVFSAIVIIVPIIVPIAIQYGVNPIHLAVIFLVNLEIGYSTPPVGMNLFIASLTFKQPITRLYRASIPYLVILLLALAVITYLPDLSLWLLR